MFIKKLGWVGFISIYLLSAGCGKDQNTSPTPSKPEIKCQNPIKLQRTDVAQIKNLSEWIDGKAGEYRAKKIGVYAVGKSIPSSFYAETNIVRTGLGLIDGKDTKFVCDGVYSNTSLWARSIGFPNIIQRDDSTFDHHLIVSHTVNGGKGSQYSLARETSQYKRLSDSDKNIFHRADQLDAQSRFYRLSDQELELRVHNTYEEVDVYLTVTYELY